MDGLVPGMDARQNQPGTAWRPLRAPCEREEATSDGNRARRDPTSVQAKRDARRAGEPAAERTAREFRAGFRVDVDASGRCTRDETAGEFDSQDGHWTNPRENRLESQKYVDGRLPYFHPSHEEHRDNTDERKHGDRDPLP